MGVGGGSVRGGGWRGISKGWGWEGGSWGGRGISRCVGESDKLS